jgi:hypothetical protein
VKRAVTVISVVCVAFALIALTAPVVKAQLIDQIATAQGSSSLCLNRAGGGNNAGTHVIAYNCYDPNDDFTFLWLSDMCGHGYVTRYPACPFNNADLDGYWDGAAIVAIWTYNPHSNNLCVADGGGWTVLGTCPNLAGNGGAIGTIFTLSQVNDFPNYTGYSTYAVNRYWTNQANSGRWLCSRGYRVQLNENSPSGLAGSCQFRRI